MRSGESERPTPVRVTENSFYALVRAFKDSAKFKGLAQASQDLWGRELDFACRPNCLGAVTLDVLRPSVVQDYLDGWDDKPGKQAAALAALRALEKWAVVRDLLPRAITLGVETGKPQGGHTPWTDAHVALAEQHARPDLARVITLGANTGQRGSDLVRMGWTDIENYKGRDGIRVIQRKTGREVWIPILPPLAKAMESWEFKPGPFLLRPDGKPWKRHELSNAWAYERDGNAELRPLKREGLVLHGLRARTCVMLSRAGLTDHQISDIVGMSIPMVGHYTRKSVQRDNAIAGVVHLETFAERKIDMSKKR